MKKLHLIAAGAATALAFTFALPQIAVASTKPSGSDLESQVASIIDATVTAELNASDLDGISFGTPEVTFSAATAERLGNDPQRIADEFFSGIEDAQLTGADNGPIISARGTGTYVADQNVAIPSLGIAWLAQELRYNITGSHINSISTVGSSYLYGLAIGTWSHNHTELLLRKSNTCVRTVMSGEFHYTVHGVGVNYPATVTASDAAANGSLYSTTSSECPQ